MLHGQIAARLTGVLRMPGAFRVLGLLALAVSCTEVEDRPNILLITVDTLRADHLSTYGYTRETSPFLTELFVDGVRFETVISQCGTTPQSLSSLMTGLYPFTDKILTKNGRFAFLRRENRTLAHELGAAGYETHAITSQIQCARVTGLDLGFDGFDGVEIGADNKQERNRRADDITDRALAWLANRDSERPFFLWLHYLDPHHPYKPPAGYESLWSEEEPRGEGASRSYRYDPKGSLDYEVSDGELARLVLDYDREIRFLDDELKRLFDGGFDRHLADSVVLFSADHGEALGDHGMIGHNDLFEEILGIPLFVRRPAASDPSTVETPVMLVDLYPTILELSRIPSRHSLRGNSLVPLLEGDAAFPERLRLAEYPGHQALYLGDYKLLSHKKNDGKGPLFDLPRHGETRDLSGQRQALVEDLISRAAKMKKAPLLSLAEGSQEMPEVTDEMLEELDALGYGGH